MMANRMRMILAAMALMGSAAGLAQQSPKPDVQGARPQSAGEEGARPTDEGSDKGAGLEAADANPSVSDSSLERGAARRSASGADRLDLDTTVVTGNRELPKVLYIVPWKKAGIGDLPAQPFNTLLDEMLMPVDRDVFRREVTYYDALSSGGYTPDPASAAPRDAAGGSARSPADGSEK